MYIYASIHTYIYMMLSLVLLFPDSTPKLKAQISLLSPTGSHGLGLNGSPWALMGGDLTAPPGP